MRTDVTDTPSASVRIKAWTPGPRDPWLAPGTVDVWRVDLSAVGADLLELLSDGEQARAESAARVRERAVWGPSRAVLRALLGRYLLSDPRELRISVNDMGKPTLDPERRAPGREADSGRLCFNLSHSGETAVYALSTAGRVGIDVEVARRPIDVVAVATRIFGPAEGARLQQLDATPRKQEFLRSWVRHEAALKCLGTGIWADADVAAESRPWTAALDLSGRGCAALAVERAPNKVRCWDWLS